MDIIYESVLIENESLPIFSDDIGKAVYVASKETTVDSDFLPRSTHSLTVSTEKMKKHVFGDLRGYLSEEEKRVPAEEIKIDFWGVFRAETPLISPIKSMLQDPIYWYYYRIPLEFNIQVIVDVM